MLPVSSVADDPRSLPSAGDVAPPVECIGVVKIYAGATGNVQALRGVDLVVHRHRTVAIVGPSGSGKSSLLRIIAGLDQPTAGIVRVDGIDLTRLPPRQRRKLRSRFVRHVYQRPSDNLIDHLTALEQVERVAIRSGEASAAALDMLERVGLADRRHHRPSELSGGEQQRLALARAAVGDASLVIADEPTAELDVASGTRVLDTIEHLNTIGVTVLLATHDPQALERLDHVVTLRDGATASVLEGGRLHSVIDQAGRLQLPPEIRSRFLRNRAELAWDDGNGDLRARPS